MPKNRQHIHLLTISPVLILLLTLFLAAGPNPPPSFADTSTDFEKTAPSLNGSTPDEVNEILADLDDGQVRQLLKRELNQNSSEEPTSLTDEIPGPGSFLSSMLRSLTTISSESKSRVKLLLSGLPKIFPDLYKVFLTL
jgi:hypothetical protein